MRPASLAMVCALVVLAACSREQQEWQDAQAADTVLAYEHFIQLHPGSSRANAAQLRMLQLAEEQAWQEASSADTAEAYRRFLRRFPTGQWAAEARLRSAPEPLPAVPAPAAAAPSLLIQLGAFSDVSVAESAWRRLHAQYPAALQGLAQRMEAVDQEGRRLFRLQASVADPAEAQRRCGLLQEAGQSCMVVMPR
ncbi:MAG: hypothetical protein RL026_2783 [Pseudomonadota bacterium]